MHRPVRLYSFRAVVIAAALVWMSVPGRSATVVGDNTLTFEGIGNGQDIGTFYPGVEFTNAIALVAGGSLDAAEFPPPSGVTVATSADIPMEIRLESPVNDFSARFTHTDPLTVVFTLNEGVLGTVSTQFDDNLALSGDPGSHPNETLSFHSDVGFKSIFFDAFGAWVIDDVSFADPPAAALEPGACALLAPPLLILLRRKSLA